MKILRLTLLLILASFSQLSYGQESQQSPNILWIITDDQRYDAVRAFNRILHNREMSELGYVESPNIDRLVAEGTTFINTYCQSPGCAPSRAAMHFGRYPHKSGVYEFEYHNDLAEHVSPTLPEKMQDLGYQTLQIGKLGVRLKTKVENRMIPAPIYQTSIDSKTLAKEGLSDWGKDYIVEINGKKLGKPLAGVEFFVTSKGDLEYCSLEMEQLGYSPLGTAQATMSKYELLRHYNEKKGKSIASGMILSGVSPRTAGFTRDGYYVKALQNFLASPNAEFNMGNLTFGGVDPDKPLFCNLGFDFPHTPVLPPEDYRKRFEKQYYKIPDFDEKEWNKLPDQIKKQVLNGYSDHFTEEEKQKMVQDYYAFCAYGDALIGEAVASFKTYSRKHNQEWMIVFVCGDHGWKLNEHGSVSKFSPWDVDTHNPVVVISSDKEAFPAGKVVKKFSEFVDIAPTILAAGGADLDNKEFAYLDGFDLKKLANQSIPAREYIIGESHAVTGPRAYIRTEEFLFSMQIRPDKIRGKDMNWAKSASYEEIDPSLYHFSLDPKETNELAFDPGYRAVADRLRKLLVSEVLSENRVEVNWGGIKANGTTIFRNNQDNNIHP
ncbi:sulfatase-like hydrolase/transferase [Algoriphagus sp. NG3]|uniref:sulfatase-like hydrolase/transferase n=1 Tax=Algoriphagus sp. NG3 TaxID=3097546 RepID=UPI002A837DDB|nr:sulfatase-like hydrolase/transferase [Algoriphagus sp. NG3]WPR73351.1 sulfatase-like hydrolase/transferase [Algoriphagus sp. NG3]